MATMIFAIAVLAAGLVMASGIWVAVVLIAAVARTKRSPEPARQDRADERPAP
jgi:hypothetical protein